MEPRELLITLNAAQRIHRSALCRLCLHLEEWIGWSECTDARAAEIGVPKKHLVAALRMLDSGSRAARREEEAVLERGGRILTRLDPSYPESLLDHPLPPPVLYCAGEIPSRPAIAVVGSRSMSPYGQKVAQELSRALAEAGLTIVSGFARGVDTEAHRAALETPKGSTVAILGCGLDIDYPSASSDLARRISEEPGRGALVTEFPLGTPPRPWNFPIRNRVIAALGFATLVVEAAPRSGSLITAHLALDLGREVYAVPGSIYEPLSAGTNGLLADGAHLVRSPEDILATLPLAQQLELFPAGSKREERPEPTQPFHPPQPSGWNGEVLQACPAGRGVTSEEIATTLGATVDRVLGALLELELGGWIQRQPGPVYVART